MLIKSRGLVGTVPIYLSEISSPQHRGLIGGISGCGIAFGTMVYISLPTSLPSFWPCHHTDSISLTIRCQTGSVSPAVSPLTAQLNGASPSAYKSPGASSSSPVSQPSCPIPLANSCASVKLKKQENSSSRYAVQSWGWRVQHKSLEP